VDANQYVFASGVRATRATLARWNEMPWPVLRTWLALSAAIAVALLVAVWVVARATTPDPTPLYLPGISGPADPENVLRVLFRNSLVLALHATACVAGFIAGASMPIAAAQRTGFSRWVHMRAGQVAIVFVGLITLFSLTTQAWILGFQGATIAAQLGLTPGELILTVLPHAIPELIALFLPLAAWMVASRRGEWDQLLAATAITVTIAIPVLVASSVLETYFWPRLLMDSSPLA
jgi:hypothetical protein